MGGLKVYPTEIENHILLLEGVEDVIVYGMKNPILNQVVIANIKVMSGFDEEIVRSGVKKHCDVLDSYKRPAFVKIMDDDLYTSRLKKKRRIG